MAGLASLQTSETQDERFVALALASPITESSLAFTDDTDLSDQSLVAVKRALQPSATEATSIMESAHNSESVKCKRHAELYFEEGMVEIQVEETLYRVPAYSLVRDSEYFCALLKDRLSGEISKEVVHIDDEVTASDFECFLLTLFPRVIGQHTAQTYEEWTSVLHLADKWGFATLRDLAVKEVFPLADDIDRIVLGRKYGKDEWLLDAFAAVCSRPAPLSLLEARRLSLEDVVRIGQISAAIRPTPNITSGRESIRATIIKSLEPSASLESKPHRDTVVHVGISASLEHPPSPSNALLNEIPSMTPLPEKLAQFTAMLPDNHRGGWGLQKHELNRIQEASLTLLRDYISDAKTLEQFINLVVTEGIECSEGTDADLSKTLALVCQQIPDNTKACVEGLVGDQLLTGREFALHYLRTCVVDAIASCGTKLPLGSNTVPQSVAHARKQRTLTFLSSLDAVGGLPASVATMCSKWVASVPDELSIARIQRLNELFCRGGKILDTPDAYPRIDALFSRFGQLRLDTRYREVHYLLAQLIELRRKGWSA